MSLIKDHFLESRFVKVYPSSFRGNYTITSGAYSGEQPSFDPEAHLTTEFNLINTGCGALRPNYIKSWDAATNTLICVIGGYYFEFTNLDTTDFISDTQEGRILKKIFIKTREVVLKSDTDSTTGLDIDSPRKTTVLASCDSESETLDTKLSSSDTYYFTGVYIGTELAESANSISPFALDTDGSIIINTKLFVPQIECGDGYTVTNSATRVTSITLGTNTRATGGNAVALGSTTIAAGENAVASGENVLSLGKNATASGENLTENTVTIQSKNNTNHTITLTSLQYGTQTLIPGNVLRYEGTYAPDYITIASIEDNKIIPVETDWPKISNLSAHQTLTVCLSTAGGEASHVEGIANLASGKASHAEGTVTRATAENAHAEGFKTIASGINSHAEGLSSSAKADNAHAEGYATIAERLAAHAEGVNTQASGQGAHTEGYNTYANKNYAHAEGISTHAVGEGAHAEGESTGSIENATGKASHSEGYNTQAINEYAHSEGKTTIASGEGAHAEGEGTKASGNGAHAEGFGGTVISGVFLGEASGEYAHSEGKETIASGDAAHSEGLRTKASGAHSHAEGFNTKAEGQTAHAEGSSTTAHGYESHAEGFFTKATGQYAHAEGQGDNTQNIENAKGKASHSEGYSTQATANYSHAEGSETIASGVAAHSEGAGSEASGDYSHAEGTESTASGPNAHAEGLHTSASGDQAHSLGAYTDARGDNSIAAGLGTVANNDNEAVFGTYNNYTSEDGRLFVVGNGESANAKHNAFEVQADNNSPLKKLDNSNLGINLLLNEIGLDEIIKKTILDSFFPVGSIYTSTSQNSNTTSDQNKNGCPLADIGGKWERIIDTFLYAALPGSSLYKAGSTGGSKNAVVIEHNHTGSFKGTEGQATDSTTPTLAAKLSVDGNTGDAGSHTHITNATSNVGNGRQTGSFTIIDKVGAGQMVKEASGCCSRKNASTQDVSVENRDVHKSYPDVVDINVSHSHTTTASEDHKHSFSIKNAPITFEPDTGAHTHTFTASGEITIDNKGVSGTNKNMPPYLCVYIWKRTA